MINAPTPRPEPRVDLVDAVQSVQHVVACCAENDPAADVVVVSVLADLGVAHVVSRIHLPVEQVEAGATAVRSSAALCRSPIYTI